jgi:hypothetical protein
MRSNTSSSGPGIGASPNAASDLSGLGMRPSLAAILTARTVRLRNASALRTPSILGGERNGSRSSERLPEAGDHHKVGVLRNAAELRARG